MVVIMYLQRVLTAREKPFQQEVAIWSKTDKVPRKNTHDSGSER